MLWPAFHFHFVLLIFVNLWVADIDIVCGRYGACCGRYGLWPILLCTKEIEIYPIICLSYG